MFGTRADAHRAIPQWSLARGQGCDEEAPDAWVVCTSERRVRSTVPSGAEELWSRCLIMSLGGIVAFMHGHIFSPCHLSSWLPRVEVDANTHTPSG